MLVVVIASCGVLVPLLIARVLLKRSIRTIRTNAAPLFRRTTEMQAQLREAVGVNDPEFRQMVAANQRYHETYADHPTAAPIVQLPRHAPPDVLGEYRELCDQEAVIVRQIHRKEAWIAFIDTLLTTVTIMTAVILYLMTVLR